MHNGETEAAVKILKESSCLSDIDGSGFNFYPDTFGGGIVRCEACFEMICDSSRALLDKDPLQVQRKMEKSPGNTLGAGLMIQKEKGWSGKSGKGKSGKVDDRRQSTMV